MSARHLRELAEDKTYRVNVPKDELLAVLDALEASDRDWAKADKQFRDSQDEAEGYKAERDSLLAEMVRMQTVLNAQTKALEAADRDMYGRPIPNVSREELPPNARVLTREQVEKLLIEAACGAKYHATLDELFGSERND